LQPNAAHFQAVVSGFATGLACVFERPGRVNDLMLYCLPHSTMAVVTLLVRWADSARAAEVTTEAAECSTADAMPTHAGVELLCFSLSCASMLGTHPAQMKPLLRSSSKWVFGAYV
jgi:hypothetical protein